MVACGKGGGAQVLGADSGPRACSPPASTEGKFLSHKFPSPDLIVLKKQAKYNINRWAVTGRDDFCLNGGCHRLAQVFEDAADVGASCANCEPATCGSTSLRSVWGEAPGRKAAMECGLGVAPAAGAGDESMPVSLGAELSSVSKKEEGILWTVDDSAVRAGLDIRRGRPSIRSDSPSTLAGPWSGSCPRAISAPLSSPLTSMPAVC